MITPDFTLAVVLLGFSFMILLGVRVTLLLILRRGETTPKSRIRNWPDATVIRIQVEDRPKSNLSDPP